LLDNILETVRLLIPRIATGLLGAVAIVALAVGIANIDQPIGTFFAFLFAGLHILAAVLIWRRSQNVGGTWTAGCLMYGLVVLLALLDIPGGIYAFTSGETDPIPAVVWGPLLTLAAPFALLSLLTSPSQFDERNAPWAKRDLP
jgi:hypothetical protein